MPTTVLDGTNPQRTLPSLGAVRDFNRGLPCGAQLVAAVRGSGSYVVATFRLTERRGPRLGRSGRESAQLADTAFLIEKHHIVQWLRAARPGPARQRLLVEPERGLEPLAYDLQGRCSTS